MGVGTEIDLYVKAGTAKVKTKAPKTKTEAKATVPPIRRAVTTDAAMTAEVNTNINTDAVVAIGSALQDTQSIQVQKRKVTALIS